MPVNDKVKMNRVIVKDVKTNSDLAKIEIYVELTNSLLNGSSLIDVSQAGDLPSFDKLRNPLDQIRLQGYGIGGKVLKDELRSKSYYINLLSSKGTEFGNNCEELKDQLSSAYSLNIYDQYYILRAVLASTSYVNDPSLQNGKCLGSEEKELLTRLQIALPLSKPAIEVRDSTFDTLASFLKHHDDVTKASLLSYFLPQVSFNDPVPFILGDDTIGQILSPDDVLSKLSLLNVEHVGCYGTANKPNGTGRRLVFTLAGSSDLKILEAYGVKDDKQGIYKDIQEGIYLIVLRNANQTEACAFNSLN